MSFQFDDRWKLDSYQGIALAMPSRDTGCEMAFAAEGAVPAAESRSHLSPYRHP
jgi:hypothetical protein